MRSLSVVAATLSDMDQVGRVWLLFDGDLLSVHASSEGAAGARETYIEQEMAGALQGEQAADRELLERQVTVVESPLLA